MAQTELLSSELLILECLAILAMCQWASGEVGGWSIKFNRTKQNSFPLIEATRRLVLDRPGSPTHTANLIVHCSNWLERYTNMVDGVFGILLCYTDQ